MNSFLLKFIVLLAARSTAFAEPQYLPLRLYQVPTAVDASRYPKNPYAYADGRYNDEERKDTLNRLHMQYPEVERWRLADQMSRVLVPTRRLLLHEIPTNPTDTKSRALAPMPVDTPEQKEEAVSRLQSQCPSLPRSAIRHEVGLVRKIPRVMATPKPYTYESPEDPVTRPEADEADPGAPDKLEIWKGFHIKSGISAQLAAHGVHSPHLTSLIANGAHSLPEPEHAYWLTRERILSDDHILQGFNMWSPRKPESSMSNATLDTMVKQVLAAHQRLGPSPEAKQLVRPLEELEAARLAVGNVNGPYDKHGKLNYLEPFWTKLNKEASHERNVHVDRQFMILHAQQELAIDLLSRSRRRVVVEMRDTKFSLPCYPADELHKGVHHALRSMSLLQGQQSSCNAMSDFLRNPITSAGSKSLTSRQQPSCAAMRQFLRSIAPYSRGEFNGDNPFRSHRTKSRILMTQAEKLMPRELAQVVAEYNSKSPRYPELDEARYMTDWSYNEGPLNEADTAFHQEVQRGSGRATQRDHSIEPWAWAHAKKLHEEDRDAKAPCYQHHAR